MILLSQKSYIGSFIIMTQLLSFVAARQVDSGRASRYRINSHGNVQQGTGDDIKEMILELQCRVKCDTSDVMEYSDNQACRNTCKVDLLKAQRRGSCPNAQVPLYTADFPTAATNRLACLDSCVYDFDCPEVQKCCRSTLCKHTVCVDAPDLRNDILLPPIPTILGFSVQRFHKVDISLQCLTNLSFIYHVEARSHIGETYSLRKLGKWHWLYPVDIIAEEINPRTKPNVVSTRISLYLKPGRWYQLRVAAISEYGFSGYSEPSVAFKLRNAPKRPKAPLDLKVVSSKFDGKYSTATIVWCASKSSLPVEKYKIIWSLYVKSKEESLISNEAFVKDMTSFELPPLLPDSSYYIQVQAMSNFGKRRLKSEKISLLYNTTRTTAVTTNLQYSPLKCGTQIHAEEFNQQTRKTDPDKMAGEPNLYINSKSKPVFQVRFRPHRQLGMVAQIAGFAVNKNRVYELCPVDSNCREYNAIRAKKDTLEFSKLNYNTTYVLRQVEENNLSMDANIPFSFITPKCDTFWNSFRKLKSNLKIEC